ncbi:MAG: ATP-binding protein [Anaerolineaceae bacterium]|nr:ATP-binding protein [Anaerolineaceae bacterium]
MAQEALENIDRHASAARVSVRLKREKGILMLSVSDDGAGFDSTRRPSERQFGLTGMRERAELVGAKLTISSEPGGGTRICMELER